MKSPDIAGNESARIAALRALDILDTEPEDRFDRLTRLSQRMFAVPIALVSLVDENRQWFKSCQGLGLSQTSRDISFCGHAILGDDVFVVPDALADERFADNPLVTGEPYIRFYAGCPLRVGDGFKIGTLCLIDVTAREFSADDVVHLRDLAHMVERELAAIQSATNDVLTHLANRRGFTVLAAHGLELCRRLHKPATLLFFDLNKFKDINDFFGHVEGDRALTTFAEVMRHVFRDSDVIGRISGDEFAVLLTDSTTAATQVAKDRFRAEIDTRNAAEMRGYNIGYSVGVIAFDPGKHSSIQQLLAEADAAMYEHKNARD